MQNQESREPQYVHCKHCHAEWVAFYAPAPLEEVVRFMKASTTCPKCEKKNSALMGRYVSPGRTYADYQDWLRNGEVGLSSKTILLAITSRYNSNPSLPRDGDDFRRCYLLLEAFPKLRAQLPKVVQQYPEWKALVERWDEVESLLQSEIGDIAKGRGSAPKTYALIQELIGKKVAA